MKALVDPDNALGRGLEALRAELALPEAFAPEVMAAADEAARRPLEPHRDCTGIPFVTLDPAGATDLDQALAIERAGADLLLHYAIADVGWFVRPGDAVDTEAWKRGATLYFPDGRVPLYPPSISEGAASLLPNGPRPAVILTVRVAPGGTAQLDGAERAMISSRAQLAYETVRAADLPPDFADFAARVHAAEAARGASRIDPPDQEVLSDHQGGYTLAFRPRRQAEEDNAALSLAANLAVAQALLAHRIGLFRVMAGPDEGGERRLRRTAAALGLTWPAEAPLLQFERGLDPHDPAQAAFMLAIRRFSPGASYAPYAEGVVPWHAAVAATYAHATAPLRRLADRYVIEAVLALSAGRVPEPAIVEAFARLPKVMNRADTVGGRIDRAVVDLAEAVMLRGRVGETFAATVTDTDERGARVQLADLPIIARVQADGLAPGAALMLRLDSADPARRSVAFSVA